MNFSEDALATLREVVRSGSFEGAAASLGIAQSVVNQHMTDLEAEFGGPLVSRASRCETTPTGRLIVEHLDEVSALRSDLVDQLLFNAQRNANPTTSARVSVNNDSLATWFPHVLKRAADELNVVFDIIPDDQEFTEERMRAGDAVAIVTSSETNIPGATRVPLGAMDYIAVATRDLYDEYFARGVSLETLADTVCIAFDKKDTLQDQWMHECFGGRTRVRTHFVPSYDGYLACCVNGAGWGLVPTVSANSHLAAGSLVELAPGKPLKVPLNWQANSGASAMLAKLGDIVVEVAREQLDAPLES